LQEEQTNNNLTDKTRQEKVYALLDGLGIQYSKVDHPPLFTQADNEIHRVNIGAIIFKNLFLRNRDKSRYYLLSLPLNKRADLIEVQRVLGETRLSFGDVDALADKLNIQHGSVSFLNVVGVENTNVVFLLDKSCFDYELIGVHPNDNTATVIFAPSEIPRIFGHFGVAYKLIEL
jgi:Ala-tRNA(Pro) deacylase